MQSFTCCISKFWTIFLNSIWIEILNVGNKTVKKLPARKTKKHQHAHFRYEKILNKTGCSEVIKKDKLNKSEKKTLLLHRNRYYKHSQ